MKASGASGFTFAELLASIPCVAILIVLLLPAVRSAKEKAGQAKCVSKMSQIAKCMLMYVIEHDDCFPTAGKCGRNLEGDWTWGGNRIPIPQTDPAKCERVHIEEGALWPYVTGMARAGPYGTGKGMPERWDASHKTNPSLCPTAGPVARKRALSYSMNRHLEVSLNGGAIVGMSLREVYRVKPTSTILLVDESELTLNDGYFDPAGPENTLPELHLKHSGGGTIAFCDAHVAWIENRKFLKIMDPKSDWFLPSR